jgi:tRNA dimethylallyltransferase
VRPIFVLTGPTACGKSGASIPVAQALGAEIVSLDSMLLYRGMDIGTDKPRDTHGIRHHLIDLLDPRERFDTRRYLDRANAAIDEIHGRDREVLVVGGTALYLISLLKGMFEGPARDDAFRARLAEEASEELHARLRRVDSDSAARLHPNDRRRITRALEVYEATGQPLSALQQQWERPNRRPAIVAGLTLPRSLLRDRIEQRVDEMFAEGLVEEVKGLDLGPTAAGAIGYKEITGYLRGEYDLEEARRLVIRNTARLARRQETWFKRMEITWLDARDPDRVEKLIALYRGSSVP